MLYTPIIHSACVHSRAHAAPMIGERDDTYRGGFNRILSEVLSSDGGVPQRVAFHCVPIQPSQGFFGQFCLLSAREEASIVECSRRRIPKSAARENAIVSPTNEYCAR